MDIGGGGTDAVVLARLSALEIGKAPIWGTSTTLFKLIGANLNSTVDQALIKMLDFGAYVIDKIVVNNASQPISNAKGGLYTGVSKSGIPLVGSGQSYAGLGGVTATINPTLNPDGTTRITDQSVYLSLTTAEGTPVTGDVYVMGLAG